jgi:hypothetical protein
MDRMHSIQPPAACEAVSFGDARTTFRSHRKSAVACVWGLTGQLVRHGSVNDFDMVSSRSSSRQADVAAPAGGPCACGACTPIRVHQCSLPSCCAQGAHPWARIAGKTNACCVAFVFVSAAAGADQNTHSAVTLLAVATSQVKRLLLSPLRLHLHERCVDLLPISNRLHAHYSAVCAPGSLTLMQHPLYI